MEEASLLLYSSFFIVSLLLIFKLLTSTNSKKLLPPSPFALPILGHLHLIKQPLHRTFHTLSQKYGPIFSLKFGSQLVVVVSSSSAVKECFTKNDIVLADRPRFTLNKYLGYNYTTLVSSSYGDHWRNLRHIAMVEVFSPKRLHVLTGTIIKDEVKILLGKLRRASADNKFTKVELRPLISALTFNIVTRMIAGKRYFDEEVAGSEEAKQFRQLVEEMFADGGAAYPGDFLPIIKYFDVKGYIKKVMKLGKRVDVFFQGLVDEHRRNKSLEGGNTMIDHLLSLQESQPEQYTDEIIKGLALNMIAGGTHTIAATLEWAMSNLLNHPGVLKKARTELDACLGSKLLMPEEFDLSKLHFLQNTIAESSRLYPAAPLLVPHMSSDYCTIGGYKIPAKTILLVNAWSVHRDHNIWEDPSCFNPERFDISEVDAYKLLPFGLGRRACPGMGLANRIVGLTLGTLIQCFEWERVDEKEIDMVEGSAGIAMPKFEPLEALCKSRSIMKDVLIQAVL